MIYIFHGDNQFDSRQAFNNQLDTLSQNDILRLNTKEINADIINNFLQTNSLFATPKVLALSNLFSVTKPILDKVIKKLDSKNCDILIWQDKLLTATQLKPFPGAKIQTFKLDNKLFLALNSIKPKNIKSFIPLYHQVLKTGLYDLFLYLLKGNVRKQLISYTSFNKELLKKVYLQLIELDFQNKTGQLSIPKELALERIIINLIK